MAVKHFLCELRNISGHLHDLDCERFLVSIIDGHCRVYMEGLGWFRGTTTEVLRDMVTAMKQGVTA